MDTRDKIDRELHDKLGRIRVEPPAGAWERIAATLGEQGLTAAAVPPRIKIRRPRRIKLGWAAAAAIVVCAVALAARLFMPAGVVIEQERQFLVLGHDELEELIAAFASETETSETEVDTAIAIERAIFRGERTVGIYVENTEIVEAQDVETAEAVTQDAQSARTQTIATNPQTRRVWMDVHELERMLREDESGRRARPLSFGLYTSSIGNTSSEKSASSSIYTRSSDFAVTEKPADGSVATTGEPTRLKHRMPLSAGINISVGISNGLSIETGVTYSHLLSRGESPLGSMSGIYSIRQELHYVGIPLGAKYDILRSRHIDLYAGAAGLFEICVLSRYTKKMRSGDLWSDPKSESLRVRGIQPSIGVHAGIEMKLVGNLGFYFEPGVNYYFEVARQPESYRTEHPFNFSMRAGFRVRVR
ncbi:MAG: PorT family protein [Rikenellaceae bacterium]|nr:PorT family protein [Rikenellaceae bacterium]MCL2692641.1 PorT family protein [Rikenellaceae bacterium]